MGTMSAKPETRITFSTMRDLRGVVKTKHGGGDEEEVEDEVPLERLELMLVLALEELGLFDDLRCASSTAAALLAAAALIPRMIITNAAPDVECCCFCSSVEDVDVVVVDDEDDEDDEDFAVVVFVVVDVVGGI